MLISITPQASLLGGLGLGLAAATKFEITGRILGISGTLGGLLSGHYDAWRLCFLAGMGAGAVALKWLLPGAFPVFPAGFSLTRVAAAGLLVGYGTSLGSGCTSGHGICGNARLSRRSMAATATFMLTGMLASTLGGTAVAAGIPASLSPAVAALTEQQALLGGWLLGGGLLVAGALGAAALWRLLPAHIVANCAEFATGGSFALGLGLSGMLQPAKVAAFLTPLAPYFDPSLAAVMGGALLVATPAFQYLLRTPSCTPATASAFSLPSKTAVDMPLLLGAALFGIGWGLGGMCPGPALVNLAQPTTQGLLFVACLMTGTMAHNRGWLERYLHKGAGRHVRPLHPPPSNTK